MAKTRKSKTGGGTGTNQYATKGSSKAHARLTTSQTVSATSASQVAPLSVKEKNRLFVSALKGISAGPRLLELRKSAAPGTPYHTHIETNEHKEILEAMLAIPRDSEAQGPLVKQLAKDIERKFRQSEYPPAVARHSIDGASRIATEFGDQEVAWFIASSWVQNPEVLEQMRKPAAKLCRIKPSHLSIIREGAACYHDPIGEKLNGDGTDCPHM